MFHIIVEGAENKAEYKFVKRLCEEFGEGINYKLYPASGNRNIIAVVDSIKLYKGDTVILFFDNISTERDFLVTDILSFLRRVCKKYDARFKFSDYFSFEELFLSYAGLIPMLKDTKLGEELNKIQSFILSGDNYFTRINENYWSSVLGNKDFKRNRESCSFILLNHITCLIKGNFKITKSYLGDCWIHDCKDTRLHNNVCDNQCKYSSKYSSFKHKIDDLDKNSVSRLSSPLSSIFS